MIGDPVHVRPAREAAEALEQDRSSFRPFVTALPVGTCVRCRETGTTGVVVDAAPVAWLGWVEVRWTGRDGAVYSTLRPPSTLSVA